jgi:hypothetical protein
LRHGSNAHQRTSPVETPSQRPVPAPAPAPPHVPARVPCLQSPHILGQSIICGAITPANRVAKCFFVGSQRSERKGTGGERERVRKLNKSEGELNNSPTVTRVEHWSFDSGSLRVHHRESSQYLACDRIAGMRPDRTNRQAPGCLPMPSMFLWYRKLKFICNLGRSLSMASR